MSSALQFDPDKHRDPHEPEHHWALRRRFLEHNMGRYPEDKLVSLAQVFGNMEFLGCRYVMTTTGIFGGSSLVDLPAAKHTWTGRDIL